MLRASLGLGKMVLGLGIAIVILYALGALPQNPIRLINQYHETIAYKAMAMFNGKFFNELVNQEDTCQKIEVFPSIQYPNDKQIFILDKEKNIKTILFIENNNGIAKVVDVSVNGKQVVFK